MTPLKTSSALIPLVLVTVVFSSLSLWMAWASEGFLEADACTHYLYARFALEEPHYLINIWGRPVCTGLYALPAALGGRLAVRATSLVLALACALIAYRTARLQEYRWPALAMIFTLAQPLVFLHSFAELTELPFAVLLGAAFWAYRVKKWWLAALLVGLTPLSRPEGFGFIALAAVALVMHRRARWVPLLVLPLIAWNYVGWREYNQPGPWWRWLIDNWPYAAESVYPPGHLLHFVGMLPAVVSPILFPVMWVGVWRSAREFLDGASNPRSSGPPLTTDRHFLHCNRLIALIPLMILIGHSVLYWRGMMASNGELRYMLVVAPFWALLAAKGWEWIFVRFEWRRPLIWAGAAALAPILANNFYQVLPLVLTDDWQRAQRVARWYRDSGVREKYPYLCAAHPGIFYFLDMSPTNPAAREWRRESVFNLPPGTIVIWDSTYGPYNADQQRSIHRADLDARLTRLDVPNQGEWIVYSTAAMSR